MNVLRKQIKSRKIKYNRMNNQHLKYSRMFKNNYKLKLLNQLIIKSK